MLPGRSSWPVQVIDPRICNHSGSVTAAGPFGRAAAASCSGCLPIQGTHSPEGPGGTVIRAVRGNPLSRWVRRDPLSRRIRRDTLSRASGGNRYPSDSGETRYPCGSMGAGLRGAGPAFSAPAPSEAEILQPAFGAGPLSRPKPSRNPAILRRRQPNDCRCTVASRRASAVGW